MEDRDDPSFDPHTWHPKARAGDKPGPAAPQSGSFDPRTWAEGRPAAQAGDPPASGARATRAKSRYRFAIAAGVAILAAGAAATWISRPAAEPATEPTGNATATPPVLAAPARTAPASRRTIMLAGEGDILPALTAAGVDVAAAGRAARQAQAALGEAEGEVRLAFDLTDEAAGRRLTWLEATRADGSGVRLVANGQGFAAQQLAARLTATVHAVAGEMDDNSFYTSAVTAGVTDSLISDFAAAFSFDLDFQREVRRGDTFQAVFEQNVNPAGQAVGPPRLLFVAMRTAEKSLRFYRFRPPGGEEGWFDDNGRGNTRALMRTPIDGARVTSHFGMRLHPTLGIMRLHAGTDFAAPIGTRIYAAADGVVQSAGRSGCGGNMVVIRHDTGSINGWITRYFHMSAFAPESVTGARVRQGQVIGLVGVTGTCTTGPHLHFEVRIHDQPVDSLSIDTGTGTTLQGAALRAFFAERERIDRSRASGR